MNKFYKQFNHFVFELISTKELSQPPYNSNFVSSSKI